MISAREKRKTPQKRFFFHPATLVPKLSQPWCWLIDNPLGNQFLLCANMSFISLLFILHCPLPFLSTRVSEEAKTHHSELWQRWRMTPASEALVLGGCQPSSMCGAALQGSMAGNFNPLPKAEHRVLFFEWFCPTVAWRQGFNGQECFCSLMSRWSLGSVQAVIAVWASLLHELLDQALWGGWAGHICSCQKHLLFPLSAKE